MRAGRGHATAAGSAIRFHPQVSRTGVRVLLCRPDHLGDVLVALPAVSQLRAALPEAHLAFAVAPGMADVIDRCPDVDETLAVPFPAPNAPTAPTEWNDVVEALAPRLRNYDVALLLRPDDPWSGALVARAGIPVRMGFDQPRTMRFLTRVLPEPTDQHVVNLGTTLVAATLAHLGRAAPPSSSPRCLELTPEDIGEADAAIAAAGTGAAPVVVHPGSGWPLKNWPADRWGRLAAALRGRRGIASLVLGAPGEADTVAAVVNTASGAAVAGPPRLSLGGLAAVHARSRLVVTTDSGAAHLAAMMGAPVAVLFGPGDPVGYRPPSPPERLRVVRVGLACSPCGTLEHPPCGAVTDPACVTGISVGTVLAAAEELLDSRSRAEGYAGVR